MLYFVKRGCEIQGPISHEQLMRMVEHKQLKKTDMIGNSQQGYFQPLITAWKQVKADKPIEQKKRLKLPFLTANRPPNSLPKGEPISWQSHLLIAASILVFGLHPLFVGLLGAATISICGIEYPINSPTEEGVTGVVQVMFLYRWFAFGTIPLMLPLFIIQGVVALIQAPLYR